MAKRPSWLRPARLAWAAPLLVAGLAGGWALTTLLSPPDDVLETSGFTVVTAEPGTVGQTLRLNASAQWTADAVLANQAAGTVTSIEITNGATAQPGTRLYSVDLRPVVVAAGSVPAFRDLAQGDSGADVAQVQRLLTALGYSPGAADGEFDRTLNSAVRSWQGDLGVTADGRVRRGDVVFVPTLPARVALAPQVSVGTVLIGGEATLRVLPSTPTFLIMLPENQSRLVTAGMKVDIAVPGNAGRSWSAEVVAVTTAAQQGSFTATLGGVDAAPICADDCTAIPYGDEATLLPSVIHVVEEVSGVMVPAAAVVTDAEGRTGVVLESGVFKAVTVVAAASGMVVVEGLDAGTRVRTPGQP